MSQMYLRKKKKKRVIEPRKIIYLIYFILKSNQKYKLKQFKNNFYNSVR